METERSAYARITLETMSHLEKRIRFHSPVQFPFSTSSFPSSLPTHYLILSACHFLSIKMKENVSWAEAIPPAQGLYDPDYEKDACGVGFVVNIKGKRSHKILSDASNILCRMTHRGASGADIRDGDGAGVMTAIPDEFFRIETSRDLGFELPPEGQYAVGNIFMKKENMAESKQVFETLADALGLQVLGWRRVPRDSSILGPAARSKEPVIEQPFVIAKDDKMDPRQFERQLYVLRKHSTHTITMKKWFYVCSLSNKNIIYKGQLTPKQVYAYFYDLVNVKYTTHFALVHSRYDFSFS